MADDPPDEVYFEVAVPAPLRRTFAYRAPKHTDGEAEHPALLPGSRVLVPFARRKVAGFVLGTCERPEGVKRILRISGLLESEPVFPPELLNFLTDAARYYMHPIGEVLRAAAPMLPKDRLKALRNAGLLGGEENIKGSRIATKTRVFARRTEKSKDGVRLGARQAAVLSAVEASDNDEVSQDALRGHAKSPLGTLRALEKKGLLTLTKREVIADRFLGAEITREEAPELQPQQTKAVRAITLRMDDDASELPAAFLLEGVTGSGKTEVYLRVIQKALAENRGALLLVPEIALTPQLVGRFRARLGDSIAVLHSGLTARERSDAWRALRTGEVRLAIGARSALFAPVVDLAVIVVDEEHDPSFKQEEGFRYNARDMAMLRADRAGAVCILGSATPAIESRFLVESKRVQHLLMPERATKRQLPDVEIVDLARHRSGPYGDRFISAPLFRRLEQALAQNEQAILFLNRRGFSPSLRCEACGTVQQCPACSVSLTEHRRAGSLRCHYCDYRRKSGDPCSECKHPDLVPMGLGTEQLEETLSLAFPSARVARLDRDTASGSGVQDVLDRLRKGEVDILVGTQMVTKGHDLPMVTVVGVVLADQSLAFPDFRAHERTFQLLCQVAGRAGRGDREGHVIYQTYQPEHPAVILAASHDYEAFYRYELDNRRELLYSPFARLVAVRVNAGDEQKAEATASELAAIARATTAVKSGDVEVLGPASAPLSRLRGRFRFQLLLRSPNRRALRSVARILSQRIEEGVAPSRASLDIDPVAML